MVDNSIYLIVSSSSLKSTLEALSQRIKIVGSPTLENGEMNLSAWIKFKDDDYYFELWLEEISSDIVMIDFDCQSRAFINLICDDPEQLLKFFLTLIEDSVEAHWLSQPPDLPLRDMYIELSQGNISHSFMKAKGK